VDFGALNIVGLVGLGLLAGTAGGLLGIGGGVVSVPGLTLIFLAGNPAANALARSASLVVSTFIGLSSALRHRKAKCVLPRVVCMLLVGGLIGGVTGSLLSSHLDHWKWIFPGVFAAFMLYVIAQNARRLLPGGDGGERQLSSDEPYRLTRPRMVGLLSVGFPMGLLAGLLGIGGGAVAVPMQQTVVRMPLRNAIACSSATIFGTCLVAGTTALLVGTTKSVVGFPWLPLQIGAILLPSAIVGAQIGAHLNHALPLRVVRIVFVVLMVVVCVKMVQKSVRLYRAQAAGPVTAGQEVPAR